MIYVPLCLIKQIHKLAFTHLLADVIIFINLIYYIVLAIVKIADIGMGPDIEMYNPSTYLLMLGMAIYSFEGISMILPIKSAMKDPSEFNPLLILMMIVVSSTIIIFGTVNYLAFGSATEIVITLNYETTYVSGSLLFVYLIATMLGFPLSITPVYLIIESFQPTMKEWYFNVIRIAILVVTVVCAVMMNDKADKYISILGAIFCSLLAQVIPSIVHLATTENIALWDRLLAYAFIFVGVANGIITTTLSVMNW